MLSTFCNPEKAFLRRGAPFTFNAEAFVDAFKHLRESKVTLHDSSTWDMLFPSFDHAMQDPVEGNIDVGSTTKIVILEGNYTLLHQRPWDQVATMVHDR